MKPRALVAVATLLAGCTAIHYESPEFEAKSRNHRTIAVLPFEMVLLGRVPSELTPAQIGAIEESESIAFQFELYDRLLHRSSRHRKHPIVIRIQHVETTNSILRQQGIAVRDSWAMPSEDLAQALGVDAVVRTSVQKTRYLSELTSYGLDLGIHVLDEATQGELVPWLPPALTRTYDIWVDSRLVVAEDGSLLWKYAVKRSTDWHCPANEVVAWITGKLARNFPYRA